MSGIAMIAPIARMVVRFGTAGRVRRGAAAGPRARGRWRLWVRMEPNDAIDLVGACPRGAACRTRARFRRLPDGVRARGVETRGEMTVAAYTAEAIARSAVVPARRAEGLDVPVVGV